MYFIKDSILTSKQKAYRKIQKEIREGCFDYQLKPDFRRCSCACTCPMCKKCIHDSVCKKVKKSSRFYELKCTGSGVVYGEEIC